MGQPRSSVGFLRPMSVSLHTPPSPRSLWSGGGENTRNYPNLVSQPPHVSGTILIVDDQPENLRLLSTILIDHHTIRAVRDGAMALKTINATPPDLILLDITMPGMSGYEVCHHLKAQPATREIPVIFISFLDETWNKVEAFQAGGVDYITRPFQTEEVLARVQTHLTIRRLHQQLQAQNIRLQEDLAERTRIERERQHSLALMQAIIDSTADGILVVGHDGVVLHCNRRFEEIWGLPADWLTVLAPAERIAYAAQHTSDPDAFFSQIAAMQTATTGESHELFTLKHGRIIESSSAPYRVGSTIVGRVAILRDVTARKQAEEAIRKSNAELEERVHERTAALEHANHTLLEKIAEHQRAEEQLRFQARLLNAIGQSVIATTMDGIITYWNYAAEAIYGWPASAAIGRHVGGMITDEAWSAATARTLPRIYSGERWSGECTARHRNGHTFPTFVTTVPVRDEQGTLIGLISIASDISERKRMEEALRESEARYRTLVETSPSAILLTDVQGTIRFCNQQAARLFAYPTAESLHGCNSTNLIAPGSHTTISLAHMQAIHCSNQHLRRSEYTMRRRDGSEFPAEISSSVVTDEYGCLTDFIVVVNDISERKQAEQALRSSYSQLSDLNEHLTRSHALLQALFDGLEDGLLLLDGTGAVQAINRAMAALLDTTPEALTGRLWQAVCADYAPDVPAALLLDPPPTSTRKVRNVRYRRPDGAMRILDVQTIALPNQAQAVEQTIVHVVDVTEPVQLQARVIENERFAASGRLAASVAHEINTPLQAIQTSLALVRQIAIPEDRERFLANAEEELVRVGQILRQLLDLYRPAATIYSLVAVSALIERILLLIGSRIREQRVLMRCDLGEDLPPVPGRPDELLQVFLNLIVNALEAMGDGGELHISGYVAEASNGGEPMLAVSISDTGPGISPDLQEHIFEPFVTTRANGTGLGLAISTQIVQQHCGIIMLKSRVGVGTTFTVQLPLQQCEP